MENDLLELVKQFIASKREDAYWDFKREHHHDKADLVHDIICMANLCDTRDAFIIFGVADKSYDVIGVEKDCQRRNQQKIVDILRGVRFAGGTRPRIEMHTVPINNHDVDVLTIKNTQDVPYYLEECYRDKSRKTPDGKPCGRVVQPFHIYTRVVDNNTPIDKNADINHVEYLWRKRFGINLPPKEKLILLLSQTNKWVLDWGNKTYAYHLDSPEYQLIQVDDMRDDWHPAAAFYSNPSMHSSSLHIKYHNTILYETELWSFDEFRVFLPKAETYALPYVKDFWYSYYTLDSIEGRLLRIFTHEKLDISSREANYHQLLIFADNMEKVSFDQYLEEHLNDYTEDEIVSKYGCQIDADSENNGGGLLFSALQVAKCAKIYEDWLKNRKELGGADLAADGNGDNR